MNILIAEDHKHLAQFLKQGLIAKSYNIEIAEDGKIALQMCSAFDYDLVLLDIRLPHLDGFDVCNMLRKAGKKMPIMMLSAKDQLEDKLNGFANGADDYLTKPFAFEELLARIQALLSRSLRGETSTILQEADLSLDSECYKVTRGGIPIVLTQKEFSLLQFLLLRKGRVLPRTVIEEQVWGYRKESMTNIVDVYIRKLRRKVDLNFNRPLIQTVRGVGYQLKETERRSPKRLSDHLYHQSALADSSENPL